MPKRICMSSKKFIDGRMYPKANRAADDHEVSRLSQKGSVTRKFVEALEDCGASLYLDAQTVETLLASGKRNPSASIMLALLAEIARTGVETLRERINSGLAEARRKKVKLGRPEGTKLDREVFLQKDKDIQRLPKSRPKRSERFDKLRRGGFSSEARKSSVELYVKGSQPSH